MSTVVAINNNIFLATNLCHFPSKITNILKRDWIVRTIQIDRFQNEYAYFLPYWSLDNSLGLYGIDSPLTRW